MISLPIAAMFFMTFSLLSCNDDEDPIITASIDGAWRGTMAEIEVRPFGLPIPIKDDNASFRTRIEFASGGTFTVLDGTEPIEGSYSIAGDALTIETDYTLEDIAMAGAYVVQTLTADSLVIYTERDDQVVDADGAPAVNGDIKVTLHFVRD